MRGGGEEGGGGGGGGGKAAYPSRRCRSASRVFFHIYPGPPCPIAERLWPRSELRRVEARRGGVKIDIVCCIV